MAGDLIAALCRDPRRAAAITHVHHRPSHAAETTGWPAWVNPTLVERLEESGIPAPWVHQREAADLAWGGSNVVVATGTGSGKSLAYLLPALTALAGERERVLYLAPTKALAADQLRAVEELDLDWVRAARLDGDTPREDRSWVRAHANLVLTNPDMLHRSVLPQHQRFRSLVRGLRFVVIDECHCYRGVFGSHVAQVIRRLRRVCGHYGADPTFILTSATTAEPGNYAARLVGLPVTEVSRDTSGHGPLDFALYEPPPSAHDPTTRRSALSEASDLLADFAVQGARTLAFVRSRLAAEVVAAGARRSLAEAAPELAGRIASYRAGYLAEDRRSLEAQLRTGEILGLATTNALELGIDVTGLDAVVVTGWPGTIASMWQQVGRAGRAGRGATAVFVARDDPLDTYLIHHPEAVFGRSVEQTVIDPSNPYVLGPHLECAAAELPLTDADLALFPGAAAVLVDLERDGRLRRRRDGWYWNRHDERPDVDLRGGGGSGVALIERDTGRLLGHVDADASHHTVHDGAVYLHQGTTYVVERLSLDDGVALLVQQEPPWITIARSVTDIRLLSTDEVGDGGWNPDGPGASLGFGTVEVSTQVVSYLRRSITTGEVVAEVGLDLPRRQLRTRSVFLALPDAVLAEAGLDAVRVPGAAHAAEHAAIGLLPLFATCDRWDIGGVSTAHHPDLGCAGIFIYDGHAGGAGFAERGFRTARDWFTATRDVIAACPCESGCPSCVQSPKCGNGNEPLDKSGAVALLSAVLAQATITLPGARPARPALVPAQG
jgi:DEAD/DEAH box helicase domain-containing protein